uniref:Chromosome segregation protein Smc putative n=1 Tax=Albugo laibachii Nc14 TaxID=890382 RepID=F0WC70_9STRA|nr:chromosome segregation protein Smc putative [Albugo laibachii Nc14]|eukprot:CCA18783.1 chromosome segregation protein Smc putative [Albugo laibachii Nc14]
MVSGGSKEYNLYRRFREFDSLRTHCCAVQRRKDTIAASLDAIHQIKRTLDREAALRERKEATIQLIKLKQHELKDVETQKCLISEVTCRNHSRENNDLVSAKLKEYLVEYRNARIGVKSEMEFERRLRRKKESFRSDLKHANEKLKEAKAARASIDDSLSLMKHFVDEEREQARSLDEQVSKLENELENVNMAKKAASTNLHISQKKLLRSKLLRSRLEQNQRQHKYAHSKSSILEKSLQILESDMEKLTRRIRARSDQADSDCEENSKYFDEEKICREMKANLERLSSLRVEQRTLLKRLCDSPVVSNGSLMQKQQALSEFESQAAKILIAVRNLEEGVRSTDEKTTRVNQLAFESIARRFQQIFEQAIPSKRAIMALRGEKVELGIEFRVQDQSSNLTKSTKEMSGGQLALLGMSYIFALASCSASPLCILDEIDAALDEQNQAIIASLAASNFSSIQVICVSHHKVGGSIPVAVE